VLGLIVQRDSAAVDQLDYYRQGGPSATETAAAERPSGVRERVMGVVGYVSERRGIAGWMRLQLQRAGLPLRANEYFFFHVLITLLIGGLVQLIWGSFLVTTAAVVLAVLAPIAWIDRRVSKRRAAFEEQLPDVLSLIAGSLRSGWGLQQAMDLAIDEIGEPASSEFLRVQSETRLGLGLEEALARMAERVDSDDFRWTVAAISIQREVGGDLAEVLDIVADTIRERAELKRHVQALTAEGRFSAIALVLIPIVVLVLLAIINRDYALTLFTTTAGLTMLVVGVILMLVGSLWLRRYTRVEV
jgi:tight adherence protein B